MNWTECGCVRHSSKYSNVVYLEVWSFSSCLGPSQFAFLANNKRKTMGWWKTCRTTSSRSWSFSSNSSPLMSCCWLLLLGCWRCGVGGGWGEGRRGLERERSCVFMQFMDTEGRSIPARLAAEEWWDPPPRPSYPPRASVSHFSLFLSLSFCSK